MGNLLGGKKKTVNDPPAPASKPPAAPAQTAVSSATVKTDTGTGGAPVTKEPARPEPVKAMTSSSSVHPEVLPESPKPPATRVITEQYKFGALLGEGGYAKVREGFGIVDKKRYAIKIIDRTKLQGDEEEGLREEVRIMNVLNHPNIVRALEFYEEAARFFIVMECVDGGELFDRIVKKQYYNEDEARNITIVILTALKYMHDKAILHRDLKPENLLMSSKSDDADVKIADFGFAVVCQGNSVSSQCGTPGYMAPEILKKVKYGLPADMWSFGVILYILLGGYPPFHDENQRRLFQKIMRGEFEFHVEYWGNVSEDAKSLIRGCLTVDPAARLTVDQALSHSWLKLSKEVLASRDLGTNKEELRKTQIRRKFRKVFGAVIAANKFKRLLSFKKSGDAADEETPAAEYGTRPAEQTEN